MINKKLNILTINDDLKIKYGVGPIRGGHHACPPPFYKNLKARDVMALYEHRTSLDAGNWVSVEGCRVHSVI